MTKIAVIYESIHHKNTEKLVKNASNTDTYTVSQAHDADLSDYDIIGIASGIYMSEFGKNIKRFVWENKDKFKKVFLVCTSGSGSKKYAQNYKKELIAAGINVIDIFCCKGYDTYGIFKIFGGISKNHPDEYDMQKYIKFIENIKNK